MFCLFKTKYVKGHLGISASALALALEKFNFCLTKCFIKNYVKYA